MEILAKVRLSISGLQGEWYAETGRREYEVRFDSKVLIKTRLRRKVDDLDEIKNHLYDKIRKNANKMIPPGFNQYEIDERLEIDILKIWEILPSGEHIRLDEPPLFELP